MKNSRRFINVFLLSLLLVFNLCATTALAAESQSTYDQVAVSITSASKSVTPALSKTSSTLVKGQTTTLKIKNTSSAVTWSSSNTKIATVSKSGKVTAKAKGKATITAKVKSQKFKCVIKVETPKLNYTSATLKAGQKKTLSLSGNSQKITWSSSSKSIATVSSKGVITAKKAGTATITAKVASGKTFKCKITVKKATTSSGGTVYITKTGHKYHKGNCRYLWNSKISISLKNAKAQGYTACSVCFK